MKIVEGVYESLITRALREKLNQIPLSHFFIDEKPLDKEEASYVLSEYVAGILRFALKEIKGQGSVEGQLRFSNEVIAFVEKQLDLDLSNNLLDLQGKILNYVVEKIGRTDEQIVNLINETFPRTGLTVSTLFTGSNSDISINTEIEKDISTSNTVYWIVSFIRWSGLRIFEQVLKEFTSKEGNTLKIITTTYLGASEPKAMQFLASLPNTQIKVSYQTKIERLHAKSYFFERNTGYDVAYIGSSNLSKSAMTDGLEWNIRVNSAENPHIIEKVRATFLHYWNSPDFEVFTIADLDKFKEAIREELQPNRVEEDILFTTLSPFPFQKEILDKLKVEREVYGRLRNLVVAATGTGKTVIAAFDYKRFRDNRNGKSSLLFVAHRKEILFQARSTFRSVLKERNFGEVWVGDYAPKNGSLEHLFISVQTFNSNKEEIQRICPPNYFNYLIIDEAHHLTSSSYRPLLDFYKPLILLGLTATPERMDGDSLLPDFCDKIAAEIRLPDALGMKLLTPFQYFCITDDSVDLRNLKWSAGKYDTVELTKVLSVEKRLRLIVGAIEHYLTDPFKCKAICFCSSKDHAVFMSNALKANGFRAAFLHGSSDSKERESIRNELVRGIINFLCVVDIYNEGVDIPEVDTVLFLRPTESLTVFLQQLGRGLRISADKDCLTVLDFVSQAHQQYNFSQKFRALVGKTNFNIKQEIESSFPHLPSGCLIRMEKQAKEYILQNIKNSVFNLRRLRNEIAAFAHNTNRELTLGSFLEYHDLDLRAIYKNSSWTTLKDCAGLIRVKDDDRFQAIASGFKRLVFIDSLSYLNFISLLVRNNFQFNNQDPAILRFALMFYYDIWQHGLKSTGFNSIPDAIRSILDYPLLVQELKELVEYLGENLSHSTAVVKFPFLNVLELHARYTRDQILAAFGKSTPEQPFPSREGVIYLKDINTDLLLVTLEKSEKDFSPNTLYEDYAISEKIFHWQSQNKTTPESPVGLSYINHKITGKSVLLFVRERTKDNYGFTCPYYFLGPVSFNSYKGSMPMSIIWHLENDMPAHLWHSAAKVAVG